MSRLVILDPGHGGIVNGTYVTPGKRSPKWKDLPQLFEGVQNREIVAILKTLLQAEGIEYLDVVDSNEDVALKRRVARANAAYTNVSKEAIYISVHADAAGDGMHDFPATGISVYTSPGQTKSDVLAQKAIDALQKNLGNATKWRTDDRDGDEDKEEHFYVLTETLAPAILCELGFMTNREECGRMQTQEWKTKCAQSILEGIKEYYKKPIVT